MSPFLIAASAGALFVLLFLPELEVAERLALRQSLRRMGATVRREGEPHAGLRWVRRLPLRRLGGLLGDVLSEGYRGRLERWLTLSRIAMSMLDLITLKLNCLLVTVFYFTMLWVSDGDPAVGVLYATLAVAAFLLPDYWVGSSARRRQRQVERELPGVLNTLAITTEAGLNLKGALEEVARNSRGILAMEFSVALEQVNLGSSQAEALQAMADRCQVPDLTLVVSSLQQNFEKGSAQIVQVLRQQALEVWNKRKRKAEELAQQASVKLFFPLMLLTFPALVIFLLAPAVIELLHFFR